MSTTQSETPTPGHLQEVEAQLRTRFSDLSAEIRRELLAAEGDHYERLANSMVERDEGIDQRVAERFRGLELAAIDRHVEELSEIEAALDRIESGRYGQCSLCGKTISAQRLEVQPTAIRCVDCQTRHEAKSKPR